MPIFKVQYDGEEAYVRGKNVEDAAKVLRAKRQPQVVENVERLGLFIQAPRKGKAATPAPVEPAWVSTSGKVRPLKKMKTANLRALARKLRNASVGLGFVNAIESELATR